MNEAYLYITESKKRSQKGQKKRSFPTIQRSDIMSCILSEFATNEEKSSLSLMYYEITKMEMKDMKYITEIAISSQKDADIYDLIKRLKSKERNKFKYVNDKYLEEQED